MISCIFASTELTFRESADSPTYIACSTPILTSIKFTLYHPTQIYSVCGRCSKTCPVSSHQLIGVFGRLSDVMLCIFHCTPATRRASNELLALNCSMTILINIRPQTTQISRYLRVPQPEPSAGLVAPLPTSVTTCLICDNFRENIQILVKLRTHDLLNIRHAKTFDTNIMCIRQLVNGSEFTSLRSRDCLKWATQQVGVTSLE